MRNILTIILVLIFVSCKKNNKQAVKESENVISQKATKTKKEIVKKNTFIVTAENGINIRENPILESKRIGSIPFGSKIDILETTNEELKIKDNGKEIKGNWVKIKTYNYPYYYSEGIEFGYVFNGFLKKEKEFILELEKKMQEYPEFKNYELVKESNPFVLNGDFFGDNIKDIVIKIKDSTMITLGFINYKKNNKEKVVIINKENLSNEELGFGWTEQFKTVPKNVNLLYEVNLSDEDGKIKKDPNTTKKLILGYNALFGHNIESCGGGTIFWHNGKFHTSTGD